MCLSRLRYLKQPITVIIQSWGYTIRHRDGGLRVLSFSVSISILKKKKISEKVGGGRSETDLELYPQCHSTVQDDSVVDYGVPSAKRSQRTRMALPPESRKGEQHVICHL